MNLSAAFLSAMDEEKRQSFSGRVQLEDELRSLVEQGFALWPNLPMDPDTFMLFLARSLPSSAAPHLRILKGGDLWLACAYGRGLPASAQCFEEHVMRPVQVALARLKIPEPVVADILQNLRGHFVEMWQPVRQRQGYSGRGDLAGWVYVCAVREANRRREFALRNEVLEESAAMLLPSQAEDPEMDYIRLTYKRELQQAFQEALTSLTSKERNLLRYYFIEKMTIDQIGTLYRVHRATAARWINGTREKLCEQTRVLVCNRISLSEGGFERIIGLIASQIYVHLALEPQSSSQGC